VGYSRSETGVSAINAIFLAASHLGAKVSDIPKSGQVMANGTVTRKIAVEWKRYTYKTIS
jgi:hypothetical protein